MTELPRMFVQTVLRYTEIIKLHLASRSGPRQDWLHASPGAEYDTTLEHCYACMHIASITSGFNGRGPMIFLCPKRYFFSFFSSLLMLSIILKETLSKHA